MDRTKTTTRAPFAAVTPAAGEVMTTTGGASAITAIDAVAGTVPRLPDVSVASALTRI